MIVQLLAVSYLAALVADFIDALICAEELLDVVQRGVSDVGQGFCGKECLVRSDDYIRHRNKPCEDIIVDDVI